MSGVDLLVIEPLEQLERLKKRELTLAEAAPTIDDAGVLLTVGGSELPTQLQIALLEHAFGLIQTTDDCEKVHSLTADLKLRSRVSRKFDELAAGTDAVNPF